MSTQIEINGTQLIPLKEAAKRIAYSRDYLAKLAREQKIIATQIGRQWFVDMSSLQTFLDSVALEQEVRKQQLREERKRELSAKRELETLSVDIKSKINNTRRLSLAVASIVLFLGVFSGSVIYSIFDIKTNLANNFTGASSVVDLSLETKSNDIKLAEPQATTLFTTVTEYPLFVDQSAVRKMNDNAGGILLLSDATKNKNSEAVANLFSDPVSVEFTNDHSGQITYEALDGSLAKVPFVSVPTQNISGTTTNEF